MAFIPNEEICSEFTETMEENSWDEFIAFQKQWNRLLEASFAMDEETR